MTHKAICINDHADQGLHTCLGGWHVSEQVGSWIEAVLARGVANRHKSEKDEAVHADVEGVEEEVSKGMEQCEHARW